MQFDNNDTALVVIDPQNDVLSEQGISWGLVGESIRENNTVENLARLFSAAMDLDFGVFISPHYLYPHDQKWQFSRLVSHVKHPFIHSELSLRRNTGNNHKEKT